VHVHATFGAFHSVELNAGLPATLLASASASSRPMKSIVCSECASLAPKVAKIFQNSVRARICM